MKSYDSYKDSGVEWIGRIPNSWDITPLYSVSYHTKEKNIDKCETVLSLSYGRIVERNVEKNHGLLPSNFDSYQRIRPEYVVLRLTDLQNDKKSLRVGYSELDGIITSVYVSLGTKENYNGKYLYYQLHNSDIKKVLYTLGSGLRQSLRFDELKRFPLLRISLNEQQQIVSFLDTKTSLIDSLIEKTQRKIELLKEKRLKLIEDVILNSNTKRIRLGYVVDLIKRPIERENNETYMKIGMYNWGRGIFKYPSELGSDLGDSTFNYLKEGDLLLSGQFSWEGSVSLVGQEHNNCISSHRFHILNGKEGEILNEYLWSYFTSQEGHFLLNENSPGSAGRNRPLNIGKLLKEKIPIPEIKVQMEIQRLVIESYKYEKYSKRRTELLKEYRQSLISEVVTGKRKVVD